MRLTFPQVPYYIVSLLLFVVSCEMLQAADFYVAATGDDANPGTVAAPLKPLVAARDAVRVFAGKEAVNVFLAHGVNYVPETLVFTAADSGSKDHPVTYCTVNEGGAVLSGVCISEAVTQRTKNFAFDIHACDRVLGDDKV